jgi:hypothetical protein
LFPLLNAAGVLNPGAGTLTGPGEAVYPMSSAIVDPVLVKFVVQITHVVMNGLT